MNTAKLFFFGILIGVFGYVVLTLSFSSIRLDEAQSVWIATKPVTQIIRLSALNNDPPLYYLVLKFWVSLFGSSIISLRSLSFAIYITTLIFLYELVRRIASSHVAISSMALFSFSPFVVWYGLEASMYVMFAFVTILNHLFFVTLINSGGKSGKSGYFFSLVAGLYTHYFFLFLLIGQTIYLLYKIIRLNSEAADSEEKELLIIKKLTGVKIAIAETISAFFVFVPWLIYLTTLDTISNGYVYQSASGIEIIRTFISFIFGNQNIVTLSVLVSFWPLIGILILFAFSRGTKVSVSNIDYFLVITFLPLLFIFALSFYRPIFLREYLIFITPSMFLLLSLSLLRDSKSIFSSLVPAFLLVMLVFLFYQTISSTNPAKEDYESVATYLNENTLPSDIILVSAPFTVFPLEYYYHGIAKIDTFPEWDRIEEKVWEDFDKDVLTQKIQTYGKFYNRIYTVLSYDQGYEKDLRGYLDYNYQILDRIVYSPGLQLTIYQLRNDNQADLQGSISE